VNLACIAHLHFEGVPRLQRVDLRADRCDLLLRTAGLCPRQIGQQRIHLCLVGQHHQQPLAFPAHQADCLGFPFQRGDRTVDILGLVAQRVRALAALLQIDRPFALLVELIDCGDLLAGDRTFLGALDLQLAQRLLVEPDRLNLLAQSGDVLERVVVRCFTSARFFRQARSR